MSARRLDVGGRIDRSRPIAFSWDGKQLRRVPGRHAGFGFDGAR